MKEDQEEDAKEARIRSITVAKSSYYLTMEPTPSDEAPAL